MSLKFFKKPTARICSAFWPFSINLVDRAGEPRPEPPNQFELLRMPFHAFGDVEESNAGEAFYDQHTIYQSRKLIL